MKTKMSKINKYEDFVSVLNNAKRELGQYPAILTSRLVNDVYFSDNLFGKSKNSNNKKQRNERYFVEKCSLNELIISFNCFGKCYLRKAFQSAYAGSFR